MKDAFGKSLFIGDTVAAVSHCGRSSVYIHKGIITRFTPCMVEVEGRGLKSPILVIKLKDATETEE